MPEALPDEIRLRVPTDLVYVRPVRKMVEGLLASQGWNEEAVDDVGLVVTEIVQNAIEHGSRGTGKERIEVRVEVAEDSIVLEVVDPGTGKDPRLLLERDVTLAVPLDAPRGRGLYLVHQLSKAFDRLLSAGGGCTVRVRMQWEAP
jgi:anti-sigma regulatory factor (Ser/Thr protein kinase)